MNTFLTSSPSMERRSCFGWSVEQTGFRFPPFHLAAAGALAGAGKMSLAAALVAASCCCSPPDLARYYLGQPRGAGWR